MKNFQYQILKSFKIIFRKEFNGQPTQDIKIILEDDVILKKKLPPTAITPSSATTSTTMSTTK